MSSEEYECAVTALAESGAPFPPEGDDELGDLPIGWTQITIRRRQLNPEWVALQQVKAAALEGILIQFPEEIREAQRPLMTIQVRSQFHSLESSINPYLEDVDDVIHVSGSEDALEALNEARAIFELPPVEFVPNPMKS